MHRLATYLLGFTLIGCTSVTDLGQAGDAYVQKQAIAEANSASATYGCPAQPVMNEAGEMVPMMEPNFTPMSGDVVSGFTDKLDGEHSRENLNLNLKSFMEDVSYKTDAMTFGQMWCWTGNEFNYVQIDQLKDLNTTWLAVLVENRNTPIGARKCAFAQDPNAWTTDVCPSEDGSVG